jgi:hypothetical protein
MEAKGHHVDIVDAWTEDSYKLPTYEYIAVAAEAISFFGGKMPECLSKLLGSRSGVGGKKGAAFIRKKGPFNAKALANLMKAMEHEGMIVNWSDIILSAPHAEALGKRIGS